MEDALVPTPSFLRKRGRVVLILVLMEDALVQQEKSQVVELLQVLILVLMEDALVPKLMLFKNTSRVAS